MTGNLSKAINITQVCVSPNLIFIMNTEIKISLRDDFTSCFYFAHLSDLLIQTVGSQIFSPKQI